MTKLADTLVNYSCGLKAGEKILIEAIDVPDEFTCECIRIAREVGGISLVTLESQRVSRALMLAGSREMWGIVADLEERRTQSVQCYIGVRGGPNPSELSDVSTPKQRIYESTVLKRVHDDTRVRKIRWVVLRWPSPCMAHQYGMSSEAFEDFYFAISTLDYGRFEKAMVPLRERLQRTDEVRLIGPGDTDLRFSVRGIPAKTCAGRINIPDGEVYTSPVRESTHGVITFNVPTSYRGCTHTDTRLVFREGRVVDADNTAGSRLKDVLNPDEGARHLGEFSIGLNPFVTRVLNDILFDEKMAGSIHVALGQAYEEASNGNASDIHWDMILNQNADAGGGQLYFDNELVRRDGRFVTDEFVHLNRENLWKQL